MPTVSTAPEPQPVLPAAVTGCLVFAPAAGFLDDLPSLPPDPRPGPVPDTPAAAGPDEVIVVPRA